MPINSEADLSNDSSLEKRRRSIADQFGRQRYLLLGLLLFTFFQIYLYQQSPVIAKDGTAYIFMAKSLATDPIATLTAHSQHPGYPALIVLVRRTTALFQSSPVFYEQEVITLPTEKHPELLKQFALDQGWWIFSARITSITFGGASLLLLWYFAKLLFQRRVANLTIFIGAALPLFIQTSSDALGDTPHLFFYLGAVFCLCKFLKISHSTHHSATSYRWLPLSGSCSGLAFLFRPEGISIALVGTFCLFALFSFLPRYLLVSFAKRISLSPKDLQKTGVRLAPALLALWLPALACLLFYTTTSGKLSAKITDKFANQPSALHMEHWLNSWTPFHTVAFAKPIESEKESRLQTPPPSQKNDSLLFLAMNGLRRLGTLYVESLQLFLIPMAFAFLGSSQFLSSRKRTSSLVYLVVIFHALLCFGLVITAGYLDRRHVLPILFLGLPWAGYGCWKLGYRLRLALTPHLSGAFSQQGSSLLSKVLSTPSIIAATVCLIGILVYLPRTLRPLNRPAFSQYRAAQWIQKNTSPQAILLNNSPIFHFYAYRFGKELATSEDIQNEICQWPSWRTPDDTEKRYFVFDLGASENYNPAWLSFAQTYCQLETEIAPNQNGSAHYVHIYSYNPQQVQRRITQHVASSKSPFSF
ncbi:MAG: glycosyltransferase family 39 protein [Pirellulaceae bacterium]|nr:glycosyltransferase family 39 protein [Pirellulaceae bacterium]